MEDEEYKKLPVEEKCVHKLWKARVNGLEEVTNLFRQIDDEKSPEFGKYLGLVKKFVTDSNAVCQEKGLEATLAYVENYAHAGKTVSEVMSGVVAKCMAAPKTRTRELALQVTLMYIEIEKYEAVIEELVKGMEQKNPKIVAACIGAYTTSVREFGIKIVSPKLVIKKIGALFADRDKAVRDESRLMVIELYRWMGAALKPHLQSANLQPVQLTELEGVFAKMEGEKASPTRYIRSQQQKQAKVATEVESAEDGTEEVDEDDAPPDLDAYDLADPVDILSKLPKDFYEKVEAKKWQERKEAVDAVENLVKAPKLESGDYGDLVRALKKIIQKDSNVMVVAVAGKCLAGLASGLKKKFQTYSGAVVLTLFEKFKEKKQNVVISIREAIDAVYLTTNLEAILEDVLEALSNKNPSVKSETSLFLARAFTKTPPASVNKKLLKAILGALTKNINEPDPAVRESSAEAIGTLTKLVGEKAVGPFLVDLEKDTLKMSKIREFQEKAVITVKVTGAKKDRPTTAPSKVMSKGSVVSDAKPGSAPTKTVKRPTGSASSAQTRKPVSGSATVTRPKTAGGKGKGAKTVAKSVEKELSDEDVDEIMAQLLKETVVTDLASANWKARLAAAEQIMAEIQAVDSKSIPTQALVKIISRKPGLKDTNFQVLKAKLDIVKYLAENANFSTTTADCCINEVSEKLGDAKNGVIACETLTAISETTTFSHVSEFVITFAFTQKSPKVQQEALIWLSGAIKEFGFANLNAKLLIENSKKALGSTNPGVRQAAITLLGTMYLYMGAALNVFFEDEKAALRDQINAEFDKYEREKPPPPTRGAVVRSASANSLDAVEEDEYAPGEPAEPVSVQDLMPRVDISAQITDALINELSDKNWKVRIEALTKISQILQEAKFIKSNLGDLPQALVARLTDSNVKIAQSALNICEAITKAMGAPSKQYVRTFFPGILQNLGDSKSWMRTTALDTINAFGEQSGYKEFFEGEMIGDALKSGSPILRTELWNWLAEKLPKIALKSIPKEEVTIMVPHLYSNLEDRNADVRKNAQEAILGIMIHLGYESMVKQTEKLKPGAKTVVMAALDKVRPNLPVKPLPKKPATAPEEKSVRGMKPVANNKNAVKARVSTSVTSTKQIPPTSRKKDDDIDMSPLLVVNNLKHQRTIDESKLKVLKWNFTQPREEFVDLLKDQMTAANVNKTLMANMFHSDFRFHIKAIESLMDDLSDNGSALMSNLDLILKWLTLRFFDTNPSVLLKGLEYLHSVFNMLIETQYHMLENEASCFIPYLVLKIGDPKDTVRNGVRALLKQICNVFPMSRLSVYIMEGIKSKNARQRAECLEVMSSLIEDYGICVCTPTPAACLKEVAKQISDRDNAVRNAALNCVVQAYYIVGEKVYKMVGNISDKDMSLLEERIKRSSRKLAPKIMPTINTTVVTTAISPPSHNSSKEHCSPNKSNHNTSAESNGIHQDDDEDIYEEEQLPRVTLPSTLSPEVPKHEITGPFKLDPVFLGELEKMTTQLEKKPIQTFDLEFLNEEIKIPSWSEAKAKALTLSPPAPEVRQSPLAADLQNSNVQKDPTIEMVTKQIGTPNLSVALLGLLQVHDILNSNKCDLLVAAEDDFASALVSQLKFLKTQDAIQNASAAKVYRDVFRSIDMFYRKPTLGKHVTVNTIKELMNELIILLVEEKLEKCGEAYVKVINVNCVKIIENSDHTNIICALVKLITECISFDRSARQIDLVMKCLWKVIKLMPSWGTELDYDSILLEVHNFLMKFPSPWWSSRPIDTPLRTIKTILHSVVKIKGAQIMLNLAKIENPAESEIESYILRLLKSLKMAEAQEIPLQSQRKSLSRANHNMLTDIFQKIGSKEETKEGLNLLYDFMQQHPEADIEPFLKKSSKFFQDYIKNGLKEIEDSRKNANTKPTETHLEFQPVVATITSSTDHKKSPEYYMEQLNLWNRKFDEIPSEFKQINRKYKQESRLNIEGCPLTEPEK